MHSRVAKATDFRIASKALTAESRTTASACTPIFSRTLATTTTTKGTAMPIIQWVAQALTRV